MKKIIVIVFAVFASQSMIAQAKVNPVIKSYGAVYSVPDNWEKADKDRDYKILVDITDAADKPDTINVYLEAVATLINLHAVAGVSAKNMHVVVVFHKMGTLSILNNEAYQKRFKMDNPNLSMLTELHNAGVQFFVCGQNLYRGKLPETSIAPEVKVAVSALTTITTYQLRGYAMINFK